MPKKIIRSPKVAESRLPLSQATLAGNVLYIGGAVAHDFGYSRIHWRFSVNANHVSGGSG